AIHITGVPSTVTAGSLFQATISAPVNDFDGTAYIGSLTLTSSDGQPVTVTGINGMPVLPTSTLTSAAGSVVATIQLNKADTLTIQATKGTWLTGSSQPFTVSPTSASSFVLSAPSTATVGAPFNVGLTAKDQFGNTATNYSGIASLSAGNDQTVSPA